MLFLKLPLPLRVPLPKVLLLLKTLLHKVLQPLKALLLKVLLPLKALLPKLPLPLKALPARPNNPALCRDTESPACLCRAYFMVARNGF